MSEGRKAVAGLLACLIIGACSRAVDWPDGTHWASGSEAPSAMALPSSADEGAKEPVKQGAPPTGIAPARMTGEGAYEARSRDVRVVVRALGCQRLMPSLLECREGADIEVHSPTLRDGIDVIRVAALDLNPMAMLYRGPLDGSYRKDGVSIIVADVDLDGHEDVSVLTGRQGAYGSPSYTILLHDPPQKRFVENEPFSELTVGSLGMFTREGANIRALSKSGCCVHIDETYIVERGQPKLIEMVTRTSNADGADQTEVKRLVDGELKAVQQ